MWIASSRVRAPVLIVAACIPYVLRRTTPPAPPPVFGTVSVVVRNGQGSDVRGADFDVPQGRHTSEVGLADIVLGTEDFKMHCPPVARGSGRSTATVTTNAHQAEVGPARSGWASSRTACSLPAHHSAASCGGTRQRALQRGRRDTLPAHRHRLGVMHQRDNHAALSSARELIAVVRYGFGDSR